jgi:GDP-4-dehydro-6-deoxy-D-mannose reductase
LEPRHILMTGASGFVGRHLAPLLEASFPGAQVFSGRVDVSDADAVAKLVRDAQPDACIHLAAVTTVADARQDPDRAWHVNLNGTLNVARAVLAHARGCRLLFASSAEIYGRSFATGRPLDETAPPAPMNGYAATKAAADLALGAMANDGLRVVRLRLFNHTGPGQSDAFVLPAFARQIALIEAGRQTSPLQVGRLDSMRDFLDVRDVCGAYVACLRHDTDLAPDAVLNIASGVPRRIGDILRELLDLAGLRAELATDTARLRGSEIPSASGDSSLARRLLGWTPTIPWQQTLADVLADWRALVAG